MAIAEVYLNQTNKRIDTYYDYRIPEQLTNIVTPGIRVSVSFGKGNRILEGFVTAIKDETNFDGRLKPILSVIDEAPVLLPQQLALCLWMRNYYCCLFYEALGLFTAPVRVTRKKRLGPDDSVQEEFEAYSVTEKVYRITELGRDGVTTGKQMNRILELLDWRDCTSTEIRDILGDVGASRRTLLKRRWIESYSRQISTVESPLSEGKTVNLTTAEQQIYQEYKEGRKQPEIPAFFCIEDKKSRFRLYCQVISECLSKGQQAVLLFPEVGLTMENQSDFYHCFGNSGAICHGQQTQRERNILYQRVRTGQIRVVMGSRSALFLPFTSLGLIIVDEEVDASYYSISMPRFHTAKVARHYAHMLGVQYISGDTIPSIPAIAAVTSNHWQLVGQLRPATVRPTIIDLQEEMRHGNLDFLSCELRDRLESNVLEGKKSLLMLNRRGYATYVFCRECGHVETCPRCGVSLKFYQDGSLHCPYCGDTKIWRRQCPECGSNKYQPMGLGLDRLMDTLEKRYPRWRILKLDATSIRSFSDYKDINQQLAQGDWDLIVGTRMLIKGLNFGQVDLAAAVLIDGDLNFGDYTSAENAYQLYSRFFRLAKNQAIIQTYEPENETIAALAQGDTLMFGRSELNYRKMMGYPPAGHIVSLGINHTHTDYARSDAQVLFQQMTDNLNQCDDSHTVYPPVLVGKNPGNGLVRYKILVKIKKLFHFQRTMHRLIQNGEIEKLESRVSIEIDPPVTM